MPQQITRKLTAILYADVAGYSRLTGADEERAHYRVMDALDFVSDTIKGHSGRVLRYAGDAVLAEFSSVVAAVNAAVAAQESLGGRNEALPDEGRVQIRVGVNLGEVIEDRSEIFGDGVNLAARLEAAAEPGGLCISAAVFDQVNGKVDVHFEDGGEETFKNLARPVHVYRWHPRKDEAAVSAPIEPFQGKTDLLEKPSIAVLPFANMSGDEEQEYFADGISEDLITALSKIRWFRVIARNSTFTYKGRAVDVKQVAEELGVRYVLEGSVRKSGRRIRLTAQLIDASEGHHIWAERYDREIEDIFELQDEMTQTIVGRLEPEMGAAERDRALSKPPESLDAWETYQRALWNLWSWQKENSFTALELFRAASERDPNFPPAYAYKAYTYYQIVIMGWSENPEESLAKGLEAARKALACDDKDAAAYFAIGRIHMMQGRHEASIAALERALAINPSFAQAYHGLGMVLTLAGRLEEAKEMQDKAHLLSPRDPLGWAFTVVHALACILSKEFEDALFWAGKTLQIPQATGYWPHAVHASALAHLGRLDEARAALSEAVSALPELSLSYLRQTLPTVDADGLKPYLAGLAKAGLREC